MTVPEPDRPARYLAPESAENRWLWASQYLEPHEVMLLGRIVELAATVEMCAQDLLAYVTRLDLQQSRTLLLGARLNETERRFNAWREETTSLPLWAADLPDWFATARKAMDRRDNLIHRAPGYQFESPPGGLLVVPVLRPAKRSHEWKPVEDAGYEPLAAELYRLTLVGHALMNAHDDAAREQEWRAGDASQPE